MTPAVRHLPVVATLPNSQERNLQCERKRTSLEPEKKCPLKRHATYERLLMGSKIVVFHTTTKYPLTEESVRLYLPSIATKVLKGQSQSTCQILPYLTSPSESNFIARRHVTSQTNSRRSRKPHNPYPFSRNSDQNLNTLIPP